MYVFVFLCCIYLWFFLYLSKHINNVVNNDYNNKCGYVCKMQVRLFDGKSSTNIKNITSVWYDDGSASDTAVTSSIIEDHRQSPVRPPRRRCRPSTGVSLLGPAKRSHSLTTGLTSTSAEIKSILKKPASLTTDDLSPVRSRIPISPSINTGITTAIQCSGSQKKTKKQVQFDIVSVAIEKSIENSSSETVTAEEAFIENTPLMLETESCPHQQRLNCPLTSNSEFIHASLVEYYFIWYPYTRNT